MIRDISRDTDFAVLGLRPVSVLQAFSTIPVLVTWASPSDGAAHFVVLGLKPSELVTIW
jgi:hypothetical protein